MSRSDDEVMPLTRAEFIGDIHKKLLACRTGGWRGTRRPKPEQYDWRPNRSARHRVPHENLVIDRQRRYCGGQDLTCWRAMQELGACMKAAFFGLWSSQSTAGAAVCTICSEVHVIIDGVLGIGS